MFFDRIMLAIMATGFLLIPAGLNQHVIGQSTTPLIWVFAWVVCALMTIVAPLTLLREKS